MKPVSLILGTLFLTLLIGCGGGGGAGSSGTSGDGSDLGRIYVTEGGNHNRIVRMDNIHGDNWASYGTGGSGVNQFESPRGIAFDSQGRMYISDWGNSRIVRVDDFSGAGWTTYGTNGNGIGQFDRPNKIAIDANDRIYIADTENDRLVRIDDMNGTNWVAFGTPGTGSGNFNGPYGVAVDSNFRIYVCDTFNKRIARFENMAGANWTTFSDPNLVAPGDIRIYGNKMLINDRNGRVILTDLMSSANWKDFLMDTPQSSVRGASGKIYVVDQQDHLLSQFPSIEGGTPVTYGSLGQNEFESPGQVTFGP